LATKEHKEPRQGSRMKDEAAKPRHRRAVKPGQT